MLGAQVPLCNTSAFASNISTVNCDVSPDGQSFDSESSVPNGAWAMGM